MAKVRFLSVALLLIVCAACSAAPRVPAATATPRPPTAVPTPRPPTATPAPDYRGMRTQLTTPLGALIISLRDNNRSQAAAHLADFNKVGDEILPKIQNDMSKQANALHSAIKNVPTHPNDLAALEQDRRNLLADIP